MGEGGRAYAQIHYDPDNLDDVVVTEIQEETAEKEINPELFEPEFEPEIFAEEQVETGEPPSEPEFEPDIVTVEPEAPEQEAEESEPEPSESEQEREAEEPEMSEEFAEEKPAEEEPAEEEPAEAPIREEPIEMLVKHQASALDHIFRTLRRLEKKFTDEILNGENRNSAVKIMYKEMNDYKAGIVEKALKNVLYDMIDLRETMLAQSKFLREKKGQDFISLEEFESYADDLGDILEKHDVSIYKGEPGKENVAVRQKITRKVETEDESLVRTVAESLSYGYEYGDKILYPERISVYIKKK